MRRRWIGWPETLCCDADTRDEPEKGLPDVRWYRAKMTLVLDEMRTAFEMWRMAWRRNIVSDDRVISFVLKCFGKLVEYFKTYHRIAAVSTTCHFSLAICTSSLTFAKEYTVHLLSQQRINQKINHTLPHHQSYTSVYQTLLCKIVHSSSATSVWKTGCQRSVPVNTRHTDAVWKLTLRHEVM